MTPEYGYLHYNDCQKLIIQEMPETTPTGQLPRSVMVILSTDLVDKVKPGDWVEVTGIFKPIPSFSTQHSGNFKTHLEANAIEQMDDTIEAQEITKEDLKAIRSLAKEKKEELLGIMADSLAPSIHGHWNLKKAVVL